MKTTIDIPKDELECAMRFTGAKTKREAVVTADGRGRAETAGRCRTFRSTTRSTDSLGTPPANQGETLAVIARVE